MPLLLTALLLALCSIASATGAESSEPRGRATRTATTTAPAIGVSGWREDALAGIDHRVFGLAINATACAVRTGDLHTLPATLTVIDYSKPSTSPRLWVFDLRSQKLLYKELVAHGQGSGENFATRFSNDMDSHQSSLGLFVTEDTYVGKNGYSLRLKGLDTGFNDKAYERAIVMHGAPYVSASFARQQGRLGRSWGCPALSEGVARTVIDRVKSGGVVFSYADNPEWLRQSRYLSPDCGAAATPTLTAF